jgi:Calcium-dependent channel, 7TM region, putative phosphate
LDGASLTHSIHHACYLYNRQLVQTFCVASLAGGITSALVDVNQVSDIFRYLAKTLPPQSVYFMQLILIQTVIGLGSELLRTTALIQALFRSYIGPRVTETDRHQVFLGLRPLSNPRYFLHAQVLAGTSLRFMVLFTFSVLSPFVAYVLLFSFLALEIGFRHQFIYIYPPTLDSGGQLWMKFIIVTIICMVVAEIVLITFMALSKATAQAYAMTPLLVSTVLFLSYLRERHFKVANFLSLETCDTVDHFNCFTKRAANDLNFLDAMYIQPEVMTLKKLYEANFESRDKSEL